MAIVSNAQLWDYLRETNPSFAKHTAAATEALFTEKGYEQLKRTGMDVKISGNKRDLLIIEGGKTLHGIDMQATDLRAGAAMIIAALCANGVSTISNINYIERGYDRIVEKLQALGADIAKESC